MKFYTDFNQLVFEDPAQYPAARPVRMLQVSEKSAGGTTHVETFAEPEKSRTLNFTEMSEADYIGMLDWFLNKVNGMAEEFSFEDERGSDFKVRFGSPTLDLREASYHRYRGSVNLEIIS